MTGVESLDSRSGQTNAALEALQWSKLQRLLAYTHERSPYYRRRFDEAGVRLDSLHSLQDFRRAVPLMRKEDVLADQESRPPFGNRLCVPIDEIVQINTTGGTSGRGQEVYGLTTSDVAVMSSLYGRGVTSAGARRGDVVALTFPMSLSAASLWIYEACRGLELNVLSLGSYDTVTKLRAIEQFQARILIATPSYLKTMAVVAETELGWNVSESPVEIILTATEAFNVPRIRSLEEQWGARVFEWYGATQRVIAWTCEHGAVRADGTRGLLHHFPYLALYETLDPVTYEPVDYGEQGELVITFLEAEGTPLIRFATGDRVRLLPASSCGCGNPYDGYESGGVERYDDMLKVRGVNFRPWMSDEAVFAFPAVTNYVGSVRTSAKGREEMWSRSSSGRTCRRGRRWASSASWRRRSRPPSACGSTSSRPSVRCPSSKKHARRRDGGAMSATADAGPGRDAHAVLADLADAMARLAKANDDPLLQAFAVRFEAEARAVLLHLWPEHPGSRSGRRQASSEERQEGGTSG